MTTQPEALLEQNLIQQLCRLGYQHVEIPHEAALLQNLKHQLEKHNQKSISSSEFTQVLNKLSKGNIFERAKTLRDKVDYQKDDGSTGYLELINQIHWCKNQYQVTSQVTMVGKYTNRYDVTLFVNGLPLVQIELKRRGLELKEAFNQTLRYKSHSFGAGKGLFQYLQLFVISNGVNTKYYANNPKQALSFKQTFFWADKENKKISQLKAFAETFLEPCHLSKMITKYIVLNTSGMLMVLRPYQYYATEAIVERVKNSKKFGYIWHTTGSGKTLTSFKASQILTNLPEVYKVVFVVDRKDLDYQTIKEFNSFSAGSIDATDNTKTLVSQLADDTKLIVTTIQKLNTAIRKERYLKSTRALQEERIVFIFDECHRSQFGETHRRIKDFFPNAQMFGFTGTPIFKENAVKNALGKRTTKELFGECLHKYVITDAIRDQNVLKFSIEYIRTFKAKDHVVDIQIEDIDRAEVMDDPKRLEKIADYILANHNRKTHNRRFTAIFCTSGIDTLIDYYGILKEKQRDAERPLRVAAIFSYRANEDDPRAMGFLPDEEFQIEAEENSKYGTSHSREKLEAFIKDYNSQFQTNFSTEDFYNYYKDIAKRVKNKQVDILLVVNMFLTGFDSKHLNTIYVDKNLQYHGLIQAYSRTNRILDEVKSQGNVVCFRNLKQKTDEAITLFSNKEAIEEIILQPYEQYVSDFKEAADKLLALTPTVESVDDLVSEEEELAFVKAFRALMRIKNVLASFTEFDFEDLGFPEQLFEDYKSKYLDLYDKVRSDHAKEKVSILDDIDFELELIHRDEINVAYILKLLAQLNGQKATNREKQKKAIQDLLESETQLRSKKELIEKFIEENLPFILDSDQVHEEFERFWNEEKAKSIQQLSQDENLDSAKVQAVISDYLFTQKEPLRDTIVETMNQRPSLKDRAPAAKRIMARIREFVEVFVEGVG